MSLAFDTHVFVKDLTAAGMPEPQAEVLARTHTALIDDKLATKQDLKELESLLKRDMKELESSLKRDMKELESRLIIRMGTMLAVAVGLITALNKLL